MRALTVLAIVGALCVASHAAVATGPLTYRSNWTMYDGQDGFNEYFVGQTIQFDGSLVVYCGAYLYDRCSKFDTSTQPWTRVAFVDLDDYTSADSFQIQNGLVYFPSVNPEDGSYIAISVARLSDLVFINRYVTEIGTENSDYDDGDGDYVGHWLTSTPTILYAMMPNYYSYVARFDISNGDIKSLPLPANGQSDGSTYLEYNNPNYVYDCQYGAADATAAYFACENDDETGSGALLVIQHALDAGNNLVYNYYSVNYEDAYAVWMTTNYVFMSNFDDDTLYVSKFDKAAATFTTFTFEQFAAGYYGGQVDARGGAGNEILYFVTSDTPSKVLRFDTNVNLIDSTELASPAQVYDAQYIAFNPNTARVYVYAYLYSDDDYANILEYTQPDAEAAGNAVGDTNAPSPLTQSQVAGIGVGVAGFVVLAVIVVVVLVRRFSSSDSTAVVAADSQPTSQPQAAAAPAATQA